MAVVRTRPPRLAEREREDEVPPLFGVIAEFDSAEHLLRAARRTFAAGYRRTDAYTPFPIDGLSDALGFHSIKVQLIGLFGGLTGAFSGLVLQVWIHTSALPINVGGRPLDSWQSFVPVIFELTVLFSALSMLGGLLILNGLPEPYHPVFNVASFARASRDGFFLAIQSEDALFEHDATRRFLLELGAREVSDVAP